MKTLLVWINKRFSKKKSLRNKLNLVFGLFHVVPVAGLIYFGFQYDLLADWYWAVLFAVLLGFSFFGLTLLRRVFDEVSDLSQQLALKVQRYFPHDRMLVANEDELGQLARLIEIIDWHLNDTENTLSDKNRQVSILKDLADLCYVTADPDEMLYVTLERALAMSGSDVGSILMFEEPDRKRFVVRAAIGLGEWGEKDSCIDFEQSIAKYAVLNKSPLVVADIETDSRFGRSNRPLYGTKSFVCMPIKTSREIVGVLNISRRNKEAPYPQDVVDLLEPLVSNAAFTYENLLLDAENNRREHYLNAIRAVLDILNSSVRGSEMFSACLAEIQSILPFNAGFLIKSHPDRKDRIEVKELVSAHAVTLNGKFFSMSENSILHKALQRVNVVSVSDTDTLFDDHQMEMMNGRPARPVYLIPLKAAGSVVDLLVLVMPEGAALSAEHPFMPWMSRCLSLALEHNRLYDAVARRNRELDSIRQIGRVLASSTFDIKQVLDYTMEMIRTIMDVEAGALYIADAHELDFAASFNIAPHHRKAVRLQFGQGIPGHVAARGEALTVYPNQDSPLFKVQADADKDYDIRSALCVPMISQGRVIGVIEVLNKNAGNFGPNDEDLLQSIASSVSIAVENAHLYKETVAMAENERGIRRIFQKFVPKEVLERILCKPDTGSQLTEELKTLSLLNIDIRGFSKLSRQLGPQKTVALLNSYFSLMGGIVFKHNGIVDKYLGDGFLAIFGAPVSCTSDADNAVNAALEMIASMEFLNNDYAKDIGVEIKIGISVHTGEVVVGNIGFDMKMDYTVIGDSVNDVFVLQEMSRDFPNSIIISDRVLRASRMKLNYLELDEKLREMKVYELLGKSH